MGPSLWLLNRGVRGWGSGRWRPGPHLWFTEPVAGGRGQLRWLAVHPSPHQLLLTGGIAPPPTRALLILAGAVSAVPGLVWSAFTITRWRFHRLEPDVRFYWPPSRLWWILGGAATSVAVILPTRLVGWGMAWATYVVAAPLTILTLDIGAAVMRRRVTRRRETCPCTNCVIARHEREFR